MKVVTPKEMDTIEELAAARGHTTETLIENAGLAVAKAVWDYVNSKGIGKRVLVLLGSGNNAADGIVAGKQLSQWGCSVSFYLCKTPGPGEDEPPSRILSQDDVKLASQDLSRAALHNLLDTSDIVIDAVIGTGLSRPIADPIKSIFEIISSRHAHGDSPSILAIDIPSGIDSETGSSDPSTMEMDGTITLGSPKIGLFAGPATAFVGQIIPVKIGIPEDILKKIDRELITVDWARSYLPQRPNTSHKGTFGRVLVLAGSLNYIGAPVMASLGALRSGSGGVTLATPLSIQSLVSAQLTETTFLPLPETAPGEFAAEAAAALRNAIQKHNVFLAGCGIGQHKSVTALLHHTILSQPSLAKPLVIDADALNVLSGIPQWWEDINTPAVLTPHVGEMAKLLNTSSDQITSDRINTVRKAAKFWNQTVVLKGPFTVIAAPSGAIRIVPFATPALATPGTGDILAGMIAGLIGQGLSTFDAAGLACFVHGAAGMALEKHHGRTGSIASDLLPLVPKTIELIRTGSLNI